MDPVTGPAGGAGLPLGQAASAADSTDRHRGHDGHETGTHDQAGPHAAAPVEDGTAGVPAAALADAGELLRALAAPVRIAIVLQLREADRCVHELVDALDVAQPLISQHLRVLKTAGVVRGDRRGREVVYRLVDDHLAHIVVDAVTHVQEGK
ncbi:metalloregulator ArsR/SmtB family transcription factor [Amycolatopsis ultiminotia]